MDNWLQVRRNCQEAALEELSQQYAIRLSDLLHSLFAYPSLRGLLTPLMLTKSNPFGFWICHIALTQGKHMQFQDADHPFIQNLKLIVASSQRKSYARIQLHDQRLVLEDLFYQQQLQLQRLSLVLIKQNHKRVKLSEQATGALFNRLAYLMDQFNLVHLQGPSGCGKTFLLQQYLRDHNAKELTLYLDESIDFTSLLGSYVCTEQIGVFVHKPGPLLHCANIGGVLILKNYDQSSEDFRAQLSRAMQLKYVIVGGEKHQIRNLKVVTLGNSNNNDSSMKCINNTFTLPPLQKNQIISIIQTHLASEPFLTLMTSIIDTLSPSLRNLIKLAKRWNLHIKKLYNAPLQHQYIVEQLRVKLFLETVSLLAPQDVAPLQLIFQLNNYNHLSYRPELQQYSTYLQFAKLGQVAITSPTSSKSVVYTHHAATILEELLTCSLNDEPCLLIGDTGCGKTTLTQHCAQLFLKKLFVFNLSEGSDAQDLIGGYRPLNQETLLKIYLQRFLKYFLPQVDAQKNQAFVNNLHKLFQQKKFQLLTQAILNALNQLISTNRGPVEKLKKLQTRLQHSDKLQFHFLTGNLIKAMKYGHWVLIDEINLATNDLLQKLLPALDKTALLFHERGDSNPIPIHPDFRLFACMNPGTDIGKKELPGNVRAKFTTLIINDPIDRTDLLHFVTGLLGHSAINEKIVDLYLLLKSETTSHHYDTLTHTFSLRNLSRALNHYRNSPRSQKDLFNSLNLAFGSGLNKDSLQLFYGHLSAIGLDYKTLLPDIAATNFKIGDNFVELYGFRIPKGPLPPSFSKDQYLITPSNFPYLLSCLRILSGVAIPVLLEGPTSGGKTSLVYFLAKLSGHRCHRINNHQNTEVEEYLGTYAPTETSIQFQEGLLVQAVRNGDWIILDELNLARSEILENLNRLLDDNQELFLPETQTTLKPHSNFRLFATQNPVSYSGRKQLSKAFRNRFIEIQVQEISSEDLTSILQTRCPFLPPTYIPLLKKTQQELNILKFSEQLFIQNTITLRDLIKWGSRLKLDNQLHGKMAAAMEGYCIIAERIREPTLKLTVKSIIEKIFSVTLNPQEYYAQLAESLKQSTFPIQWNRSFIRMAALALKCVQNKEPALLIGPAGIGKTTLVGVLSEIFGTTSQHLVCHQYLEISDFVGALRPSREQEGKLFDWQDGPLLKCFKGGGIFLIDEVNMCPESVLEGLNSSLEQPPTLTVNDQFYSAADQTFAIIAAMNPSGDWGKKELTPALRSRFTEIYVENPLKSTLEEIESIVSNYEQIHCQVVSQNLFSMSRYLEITFRDLLQIIEQIRILRGLHFPEDQIVQESLDFAIVQQLENDLPSEQFKLVLEQLGFHRKQVPNVQVTSEGLVMPPYKFKINQNGVINPQLNFPSDHVYKILRALQYSNKPIMIQGPPSSGKTYLIKQLAAIQGIRAVKIIFDEQSDLQELLGTDQPNSSLKIVRQLSGRQMDIEENLSKAMFRFVEGPLLDALMKGHWIILKNLNLAPQNVLEGLNSILDHRKEIFIPELGRTIQVHQDCRIFAVQNPMTFGEGRKGLPASFLNRFIRMQFKEYEREFLGQIYANIEPILAVTQDIGIISNYVACKSEVLKNKFFINPHTQATYDYCDASLWSQQRRNFSDMIHMLSETRSFFVIGPRGIGKKTLVQRISKFCDKKLVHVLLSKQTDSLELMGQYEQSESQQAKKFGLVEDPDDKTIFKWRFSKLVEAAIRGQWVLIDDLNLLNKEVLPKIVPFAEEDCFSIFGEVIKIHPEFRLFLTSTEALPAFRSSLKVELAVQLGDEIDELNYRLDVKNIMNQELSRLLGPLNGYTFSEPILQSQIMQGVQQIRCLLEEQLLNDCVVDDQFLHQQLLETFGECAPVENKTFFENEIISQIRNPYIEIMEVYEDGLEMCENRKTNWQRQSRRILLSHYDQLLKDEFLYSEYFTYNDENIKGVLFKKIMERYQIALSREFKTSLLKLQQKSKDQITQITQILNHLSTVAPTGRDAIMVFFVISRFTQKISEQLCFVFPNANEIFIYCYLIKKLCAVSSISEIPSLIKENQNLLGSVEMLRTLEQWQYAHVLDYLKFAGSLQTDYFQTSKLISSVIEELRGTSALPEFLAILAKCFENQQAQEVLDKWLKSLLKHDDLRSFEDLDIILSQVNLHQSLRKLISEEINPESLDQPLDFEILRLMICYQRPSNERLQLVQSVKGVQNFIDCLSFYCDPPFVEEAAHFQSNPLKFYDGGISQYIEYLKVKQRNISGETASTVLINGYLCSTLQEEPYYRELIKRYLHAKSLVCFRSKQSKQLNLDEIKLSLAKLNKIDEDQLIQMSSHEVQLYLLENLALELKRMLLVQQECAVLISASYQQPDKAALEFLQALYVKIQAIQDAKIIRDPKTNNIDATQLFLTHLIDGIKRILDLEEDERKQKQFIEVWIISTYEKYFHGFKDILTPIFKMLMFWDDLVFKKPHLIDNSFLTQLSMKEGSEFIEYATSRLISQEERDLFKMDDAKAYILLSKKINGMIVDQYTEEAVKKAKDQFEQQKEQELNTFKEEFLLLDKRLSKDQITERVKSELSSLDIDSKDYMDFALRENQLNLILSKSFKSFVSPLLDLPNSQIEAYIYYLQRDEFDTKIQNVYKQNLPAAKKPLHEGLMKLLSAVSTAQQDQLFSENEVLLGIGVLIRHLLSQNTFSIPLIKFMSGLDVLLQKVEFWDTTVPKQFKLIEHCDLLIDLLIKWRKIERDGWRSILGNKIQELWAVESIIVFKLIKELDTQKSPERMLDTYLGDSMFGTFEIRLILLNQLLKHLKQRPYYLIVKQKLQQFSIFVDHYNVSMKATIQAFSKEIDEYRKLVSWNSKNYMIIQSASEKMHGKLIKVQGRFRSSLNEKFANISNKYLDEEFQDSLEGLLSKNFFLKTKGEGTKFFHEMVEGFIRDSFERMEQLKETKSNVKLQALKQFQEHISSFFGLKLVASSALYNQLLEQSYLITVEPHSQLDKTMKYYYKAIAVLKQSLLKSITKAVPSNYLNKCVALLHDLIKKLTLIFKLIRPLLVEEEQLRKDDFNQCQIKTLEIYAKCFVNNEVGTMLKHFLSHPNQQTKLALVQLIQSKFQQFDPLYKDSYHLLKELQEQIFLINFDIGHASLQDATEVNPKIKIVWAKYLKAIQEKDGELLQSVIKILHSFNKYPQPNKTKEQIGILLRDVEVASKLFYLMTVVFSNILVKGFCSKDDEQEEEDGEGELKAGTGVGEGKGQQNVTKEIEFEEQLVGEQQGQGQQEEEEQDQEQKDGDKKEKEDEFDMENDFEGKNERPPEKEDKEQQDENELEKEKSDLDEGFSSVEEDNPDMKHYQGEEEEDDGNEEDKEENNEKQKKSDVDVKAEQQKQQELKAKKDEAEKRNDQKRNVEEFEETSHKADSQIEEDESDLEELESQSASAKSFGGKGGEQLDEIDQEQLEEDDLAQENQQNQEEISMNEEQEGEEQLPMEEEVRFDEPHQGDEAPQEQIEDQELFMKEQIDEEPEGNDGENDQKANNKIFKEKEEEQNGQGEGGDDGEEGQVEVDKLREGEDNKKESKKKEAQKGESMLKKLFDVLEQKLTKEELSKFKKDVNVQDNEAEDAEEEEANIDFKINRNEQSSKIDQVTNLPVQNQDQQQNIKKSDLQSMEQEESQNEQEKDNIQRQKSEDKNKDQMDQEKKMAEEQRNDLKKEGLDQLNPKGQTAVKDIEISNKVVDINYDEFIKQFFRGQHDQQFDSDFQRGLQLWYQIEKDVLANSIKLSEELKAILVATQVSALRGDFKTGKRLNMKKIIPYIASNFRKDKIWLRRSQPQKRNYQIMLALDDSLSMNENRIGELSLQSLASLALALSKMEAGQLAITSIHEGMRVLHEFEKPFSAQGCPHLLGHFSFAYESHQSSELSLMRFMRESIDLFKQKRSPNSQQVCFIISDGKFNKKMVRPLVREAEEQRILYVFIIIDREAQSILNIKSTNYVVKNGKPVIEIKSYLEDFPYKHYVIIKTPTELNNVLVNILRQYYQLMD